LVANLTFAGRHWRAERLELVETRTSMAQMVAAYSADAVMFRDKAAAHDLLLHALDLEGVRSVQLFDGSGELFMSSGPEPIAQQMRASTPQWFFRDGLLQVNAPVRLDQQRVGELVLLTDLSDFHGRVLRYALFAALLAGLLAGSAGAIAWTLSGRVTRPLSHLTAAMRHVREGGDFKAAVADTSYIELAELVSEFNALLVELGARERELQTAMGELIVARDEAEQANRLKTEFLANVSHELRTPLNGVLGVAHLMGFDQLIPAQRERLAMIQRSGEDLLATISNVLDVARLEAGEVDLDSAEFDPREVVTRATAEASAAAADKGLRFELKVALEPGEQCVGDPHRLEQVIRNLACNAVKFTQQGGVNVVARREQDDFVCLIKDTGVGMAADVLSRLFRKFEQADNSTTRRFGGLGLGLVICRELIVLFGGSIRVDSIAGAGSSFEIRLPLPPARPKALERAAA
jgi:signal transduction histidine kinase